MVDGVFLFSIAYQTIGVLEASEVLQSLSPSDTLLPIVFDIDMCGLRSFRWLFRYQCRILCLTVTSLRREKNAIAIYIVQCSDWMCQDGQRNPHAVRVHWQSFGLETKTSQSPLCEAWQVGVLIWHAKDHNKIAHIKLAINSLLRETDSRRQICPGKSRVLLEYADEFS